ESMQPQANSSVPPVTGEIDSSRTSSSQSVESTNSVVAFVEYIGQCILAAVWGFFGLIASLWQRIIGPDTRDRQLMCTCITANVDEWKIRYFNRHNIAYPNTTYMIIKITPAEGQSTQVPFHTCLKASYRDQHEATERFLPVLETAKRQACEYAGRNSHAKIEMVLLSLYAKNPPLPENYIEGYCTSVVYGGQEPGSEETTISPRDRNLLYMTAPCLTIIAPTVQQLIHMADQ
ncbi:MAG TPA: hypothetical protein VN457_07925, partial [Chlamydiales bacterium]|nr:hypothetical protein [Chlamydiales bacterium]